MAPCSARFDPEDPGKFSVEVVIDAKGLWSGDAGREAILALSAEASEEIRLKLEAVREAEVLVEEEEEVGES